jgi:hypothetical protein
VFLDFCSAFNAALADVEKGGGVGLRHFASWRKVGAGTLLQGRQLRRHHRALTLVQMSALEI